MIAVRLASAAAPGLALAGTAAASPECSSAPALADSYVIAGAEAGDDGRPNGVFDKLPSATCNGMPVYQEHGRHANGLILFQPTVHTNWMVGSHTHIVDCAAAGHLEVDSAGMSESVKDACACSPASCVGAWTETSEITGLHLQAAPAVTVTVPTADHQIHACDAVNTWKILAVLSVCLSFINVIVWVCMRRDRESWCTMASIFRAVGCVKVFSGLGLLLAMLPVEMRCGGDDGRDDFNWILPAITIALGMSWIRRATLYDALNQKANVLLPTSVVVLSDQQPRYVAAK